MFEISDGTFAEREETILQFWEDQNIFAASLENRALSPVFSFYDGPPFATGLPHYGHILAATLKDVIPRYKTMKGFYVPRRFGWDCHGLPVENEIEKAKELSGAHAIENFGIAEFNEECRSIVLRYTSEWKKVIDRMGRWVSFDDAYRTMDTPFMESVWWVFGQLYGKGLIYEGFKVMPFSTRLGTPLSNFEANLNYKEVDDPSITIAITLIRDPTVKLLVWTTTPWTLPSNLAIMVRGDLSYVQIRDLKTQNVYILGKETVNRYFPSSEHYEIIREFLGSELAGQEYEPIFPYFADRKTSGAFRIILEESLSETEGTGLVHTAPAFGEIDFFACLREGIDPVCPVDQNGCFTQEIPAFAGQYVKDADKEIIRSLKAQGKVFLHTQIRHRYPFCWRSDTPLIYKTVRTWFVAVEKIKDRLIAANEQIHWVPGHIQQGRFGKWLENARDWAISRNRYWGTPIPIWRNDAGEIRVITSIQELEQLTGNQISDLHRHFIDDLTFEEDGKIFRRIPEVFDCWFESGSMPYAQNHFPFENREKTLQSFPADYIAEGLDQTRGWFYTLTVLSAALFEKNAFSHVIVNGIILAEDGNKMSKRLKNYPEPTEVFHQYGVDAVRLYLLQSPAVYAEDLKFTEKDVEQTLRQIIIPLWNSFVFLSTYATISHWSPPAIFTPPTADIDRWALSIAQKLISDVTEALDRYELHQAVTPLITFVDQMTNWYIRRTRSRFWSGDPSQDQTDAFATLYQLLYTFCQVAAPCTPFITEVIYRELRKPSDPISVHLTDYPIVNSSYRDLSLEEDMHLVQTVVSMGHSLRKSHKIKVRQPLQRAHLVSSEATILQSLQRKESLIREELNVKEISYHSDETAFVTYNIKPNFRVLGKKVGPLMPQVQQQLAAISYPDIRSLQQGGTIQITCGEQTITISWDDVIMERHALESVVAETSGLITIALDIKLSDALIEEGIARELINRINTLRKEQDFSITDRIILSIKTSQAITQAIEQHYDTVCRETLSLQICFVQELEGTIVNIQDTPVILTLQKSEG